MDNESTQKLYTLLAGFVFFLAAGLLIATIYASFQQHDTAKQALTEFDILGFLYERPFSKGYLTPVFRQGLIIICVVAVLGTALLAIVVLRNRTQHGTARWANLHELKRAGYIKRYNRITGPIFGKTMSPRWNGSYLTNGDQPHSLIVAPTRAGKGVGVVIPTLLTFNGSILALDVKGELFELTSRARKSRGDHVFKFAPFDVQGRTHSYNPVLDIVKMRPDRQFSETRRLAHNLIEAKGKGAEGFIEGARDLFVAGILACIERGTPTIGAVYDLFAQPGEKYKLFAQLAEECKNKEAQRIFDNMAGNDTKILTSYTSVLGDGGLNLWADPLIKAATTRSDFSIYDLRRDPTAIFLCVSPNDLEVIAPLIRLFFQQIVSILQRSMPGKDEIFEVLFLLDEFKHLGRLEAIETAVTTIAGYSGRFMFIIQSLAALTGAYEESGKENFLSNTGIQVFMATADDETPNYISKAIGDYTFRARSTSFNQSNMFDTNIQLSYQGAPLMRAEQVRLIDDETQIVLIKGQPPLRMKKVKYYSDCRLRQIFERQTGPLPEPDVLIDQTPLDQLEAVTTFDNDPSELNDPISDDDILFIEDDDTQDDPVDQASDSEGTASETLSPGQAVELAAHSDGFNASAEEIHDSEEESKAMADQRALLDRIIALQHSKIVDRNADNVERGG